MGQTSISNYYKSFSGTDTLAFIILPDASPVVIGSLTTISYSMYRNKRPVINIGRTNINGVTRGSRIFAGTMIFTLINQHWLKELQEKIDWMKEYDELKVDELPLFDIMIVSANEYGNSVTMYIYGVDFTDEAQTVSVEDLFTENTFSFIARDISVFKANTNTNSARGHSNKVNKRKDDSQRFYVLDSSNVTLEEISYLEQEMYKSKLTATRMKEQPSLSRDLYYSSSKLIIGNDVSEVQELLNYHEGINLPVNGVFDKDMEEAVKLYQSKYGYDITGVVTNKIYAGLLNKLPESTQRLGIIVNKYGSYVYRNASMLTDIVDVIPYKESVRISEVVTNTDGLAFQRFYKTSTGYILEEDVYSAYYTGNIVEFPIIEYNDKNIYVSLLQEALDSLEPYGFANGIYDYETQQRIKKLQEQYGLEPNGIVTHDTWLLVQSLTGSITSQISDDGFKIDLTVPQGTYNVNEDSILSELDIFNATISCNNYITTKFTAIVTYDKNETEIFAKTIRIKEPQTFNIKDLFMNAFIYNPKHGKSPKRVDYIIYPYSKKPLKWTILL